MTRAWRLPLVGLGGTALWTGIASYTYLAGTQMLGSVRWPAIQWWLWLAYSGPGADDAALWLKISGGVATLATALPAIWCLTRPPGPDLRLRAFRRGKGAVIRGTTDNHGHAAWASMVEIKRMFPGPDPDHGGVVVGEAYRPDENPEMGGKAELVVDPCDKPHSLVIAGSRAFKTSTLVSTILHWTGSAVVLDPSCELGPMTARARETEMGHRVFQLSLETAAECGVNVLDWIDTESPEAGADVHAVVSWIFGEEAKSGDAKEHQFRGWGKDVVTCLLAHMLWDSCIPKEEKTLRRLRHGIVLLGDNMEVLFDKIQHTSESSMARDLAGTLKKNSEAAETWVGIYGNATQPTSWLSTPAYAELVSGTAFKTEDVTKGAITVFLQLPLKTLMTTPAVGRVLLGSFLNAAYEADGETSGRILFSLDEVAQLGPMEVLMRALATSGKYDVTLQLFYQDVGQILRQWGAEGKRSWYNSVGWRAYAAIADLDTAKELQAEFGEYGALASSEGSNSGTSGKGFELMSRSRGTNKNVHEISRPLIKAAELLRDTREDELFVVRRSSPPIRMGRAIYWRRPEMLPRVDRNRFVKSARAPATGG